MNTKNIVLVGGMVNTINALKPLQTELEKRGQSVTLITGTEPALTPEELAAIQKADFIFSGMAAPETHSEKEIFTLNQAMGRNTPYGMLSDTDGGWSERPWFDSHLEHALLVAIRNSYEKRDAVKRFSENKVVVVGHPTEETILLIPQKESYEIRELLRLNENEIAIYLGGAKDMETNRHTIPLVDNALRFAKNKARCRFFFGPHPGVTGPKAGVKEIPLSVYREVSDRWEIIPDYLGNAESIMHAFDAFLFSSGTAYKSALWNEQTEPVLLRTPYLVSKCDSDTSYIAHTGAVRIASDEKSLAALFQEMKAQWPYQSSTKANRDIHLEKPGAPGTSVNKMADAIESVLKNTERD